MNLTDAEKAEVAVKEVLLGSAREMPFMAWRDRFIARVIGKLVEKSVLSNDDVDDLLRDLLTSEEKEPPKPLDFPVFRIKER